MTIDVIGREFGPYFGRVFSTLELDLKTLQVIPAEHRLGEAHLFQKKREKYRHLHPMAATMLFAEHYVEAYRWVLKKREDFRVARGKKVFSAANPMDDTEQNRVGLWLARRAADMLGADYQEYCVVGLDYSERAGWKRLALPRELANDKIAAEIGSHLTWP